MLLSTKKTAIALAVSTISSLAVADGVIEGRVSDQTGEVFFDGAIVELVGTTQSAVAAKGGFFRFNNVRRVVIVFRLVTSALKRLP